MFSPDLEEVRQHASAPPPTYSLSEQQGIQEFGYKTVLGWTEKLNISSVLPISCLVFGHDQVMATINEAFDSDHSNNHNNAPGNGSESSS